MTIWGGAGKITKALGKVGWGSFDFLKNTIVKEKEVNNMRTLEIFAKSGKQRAKSWVTLKQRMTIKNQNVHWTIAKQ